MNVNMKTEKEKDIYWRINADIYKFFRKYQNQSGERFDKACREMSEISREYFDTRAGRYVDNLLAITFEEIERLFIYDDNGGIRK